MLISNKNIWRFLPVYQKRKVPDRLKHRPRASITLIHLGEEWNGDELTTLNVGYVIEGRRERLKTGGRWQDFIFCIKVSVCVMFSVSDSVHLLDGRHHNSSTSRRERAQFNFLHIKFVFWKRIWCAKITSTLAGRKKKKQVTAMNV